MIKKGLLLALWIFGSFVIGLGQPFEEVSQQVGIDLSFGGDNLGGGLSFADFNDDGWDDLTFATGDGRNIYFFQNNNGVFENIGSLITNVHDSKALIWFDFDNDGDKDLFVTNNKAPNKLYENDGNLNLTDISSQAGFPDNDDATYGVSAGDYNLDGWLDLYLSNYTGDPEFGTNLLYKNNGDGTFTDVTNVTGTDDGYKLSFCTTFFDMNRNGWQDLYIANDKYEFSNTMFKNVNGIYEEITQSSNTDLYIYAMNVGVGDYDNDGDLDIYVTNSPDGNKLLRNNGDETFTEVADDAGVGFYRVGWGGNFFDYDYDRDLDLYVSSGRDWDDEPNALYENNGDGTFTEYPGGLPGDTLATYANAYGDFNNDGYIDIISHNVGDSTQLWRNEYNGNNNHICVELEGTDSNRDGVGSWLELHDNDQVNHHYTTIGTAYCVQNTSKIFFGLNDETEFDSLMIYWLSGNIDTVKNILINRCVDIVERGNNFCGVSAVIEIAIADPNQMVFYMEPVSNLDYYEIRYRLVGTNTWDIKEDASTEIHLFDLQASSTYEYQFRTICETGFYSDWSDTGYFTTIGYDDDNFQKDLSVDKAPQVLISPNPAVSEVNFSFDKMYAGQEFALQLTDLSGRTVFQDNMIVPFSSNQITIHVDDFSEGIYMYHLHTKEGILIKEGKLVVAK